MAKCVANKRLGDGSSLKIIEWESDVLENGRNYRRLELEDRSITLGFPPDYTRYNDAELWDYYGAIMSYRQMLNLILAKGDTGPSGTPPSHQPYK
ncbi:MAG: hypothetical protein HY367_02890 [Candidatus Aenigmarchaeota archaeon]|nr:hypothetical protein [Candidatus Aenigmarchaeota archaeon]